MPNWFDLIITVRGGISMLRWIFQQQQKNLILQKVSREKLGLGASFWCVLNLIFNGVLSKRYLQKKWLIFNKNKPHQPCQSLQIPGQDTTNLQVCLARNSSRHWEKIIFGGKLKNPNFCHIFGMESPFFLLKRACIRLA